MLREEGVGFHRGGLMKGSLGQKTKRTFRALRPQEKRNGGKKELGR